MSILSEVLNHGEPQKIETETGVPQRREEPLVPPIPGPVLPQPLTNPDNPTMPIPSIPGPERVPQRVGNS